MTDKVPGIYKKLHAIMSEANYIQKDKENKFHGYSYASEAAIKDKLHELFVKHGVLPNFSTVNVQTMESHKNDKGKAQFRTTLDLAYRFIDVEDGSQVEGTMAGAGMDGEDKGVYKATTGALKYCLTSQFIIPTGDDPENGDAKEPDKGKQKPANKGRESTTIGAPLPLPTPHPAAVPPPNPPVNGSGQFISEKQRSRFIAIYSKSGWKDDDVKTLLNDYLISSRSLIPKGEIYDRLCTIVESPYKQYLDLKTNKPA